MTTPPAILYKYLDADGAIKTLENHTLKFSSPLELNDPFEGLFATITEEQIEHIINKLKAQQSVEDWIYVLNDYLNIPRDEALSYWEGLGRNTSIEQIVHTTMDNFDGIWKERHKAELEKIALSSFSETPTNVLMWAHYTKKHTGCVIGVDSRAFDFWLKVRYSSERIPQPMTAKEIEFVSLDSIRTKAMTWEYEKEWRLVEFADKLKAFEGNLIMPIKPETIKIVILGLRQEEQLRNTVRLFKHNHPKCEVCRATIHPVEYKMEICPFGDSLSSL